MARPFLGHGRQLHLTDHAGLLPLSLSFSEFRLRVEDSSQDLGETLNAGEGVSQKRQQGPGFTPLVGQGDEKSRAAQHHDQMGPRGDTLRQWALRMRSAWPSLNVRLVCARVQEENVLCADYELSRGKHCHDVGLEFGEGQVRCVAPCPRNSWNNSRSVPPEMNAGRSPQFAALPACSFPREVSDRHGERWQGLRSCSPGQVVWGAATGL